MYREQIERKKERKRKTFHGTIYKENTTLKFLRIKVIMMMKGMDRMGIGNIAPYSGF